MKWWIQRPIKALWLHAMDDLYRWDQKKCHALKRRIEAHEHADSIKHQIEEIAKELTLKEVWEARGGSILKPFVEGL